MNWTKVAEFPLDAQLNHLNDYLESHSIQHRFTEERGIQVLWLANISDVSSVQHYFQKLEQGDAVPVAAPVIDKGRPGQLAFSQYLQLFPVTIVIIILGILGYLVVDVMASRELIGHLQFEPFLPALKSGELWRVLTPTFLHFDLLHILFNALWIWELGRRIEVFSGRRSYIVTFLITAIAANYLQHFLTSGKLFGGLSGVVYAYLGYLMVWGRYAENPLVKLPPGISMFMLVWLALGFTGVIDVFISGRVANGAHLGGFLSGIAIAFAEVIDKRRTKEG